MSEPTGAITSNDQTRKTTTDRSRTVSTTKTDVELIDTACADCGNAVRSQRRHLETYYVWGAEGEPEVATRMRRGPSEIRFGICADCRGLRDFASRLMTGKPRADLRGGPDPINADRAAAALHGWALAGRPRPEMGEQVGSIIRNLLYSGTDALYCQRFSPIRARGAVEGQTNAEPWAHLNKHQRGELRSGVARVLNERVAAHRPPVELAPPRAPEGAGSGIDGGCLFCGLRTVEMDAVRVAKMGGPENARERAWAPITVQATTAGAGRGGSGALRGHLCPVCEDAREATGAAGATAMDRSYRGALTASGRRADLNLLPVDSPARLRAWGAIPDHQRPRNRAPWAHVRLAEVQEA